MEEAMTLPLPSKTTKDLVSLMPCGQVLGKFFDAMVRWYPKAMPEHVLTLSEVIVDQNWFFRSWKLDPTIQAALTMLNAMHARFATSEGLYARLVNTENPYISFSFWTSGISDYLMISISR
jgi:hypothetical protein